MLEDETTFVCPFRTWVLVIEEVTRLVDPLWVIEEVALFERVSWNCIFVSVRIFLVSSHSQ